MLIVTDPPAQYVTAVASSAGCAKLVVPDSVTPSSLDGTDVQPELFFATT
jgi:hypothetical protein